MFEEMADAVEPVLGDLADVIDLGIAFEHLVDRHRHQLLVGAGFVLHAQDADRAAADDRARHQRQRQNDQHIGRIAIAAQGVRDVSVVAGVTHRGRQDPVDEDGAGGFVHFVFHRFGVFRDFDDDVHFVRNVFAGLYQVQAHGLLLELQGVHDTAAGLNNHSTKGRANTREAATDGNGAA